MSYFNDNTKHPQFINNLDRPQPLEPEYAPDWLALEQEALLMHNYWELIAQVARLEQVLENLDNRGRT